MAGCYGWVSPRLSGLRLSKHTNRPPSLLLLRGAAWVYPSVKRAGTSGVGGGNDRERRARGELGKERAWTTTMTTTTTSYSLEETRRVKKMRGGERGEGGRGR